MQAAAGWNDPRWAQLYPPRLGYVPPASTEPDAAHDPYLAEPVAPNWPSESRGPRLARAGGPTYLDLLQAEAMANPVTDPSRVQPAISLPGRIPGGPGELI